MPVVRMSRGQFDLDRLAETGFYGDRAFDRLDWSRYTDDHGITLDSGESQGVAVRSGSVYEPLWLGARVVVSGGGLP